MPLDTAITAQLLELDEEEPGFLSEVIQSFFENAAENLASIRTAVENEDLDAVRAAAHMMRGSSQQLGAGQLGATCFEIEKASTAQAARPILGTLELDLEAAREALTNLASRALDAAS